MIYFLLFFNNREQDEYLVNVVLSEKTNTKVELISNAELEKEHIFALQAAIVRSLKHFKSLDKDRLIKLVAEMFKRRFVVSQTLFEKAIEPLIEKGICLFVCFAVVKLVTIFKKIKRIMIVTVVVVVVVVILCILKLFMSNYLIIFVIKFINVFFLIISNYLKK